MSAPGALGAVVPIYELIARQGVFTPEEVTMLANVFEDVLRTLGLVDRKDPMTEMVAKKLIELATPGMRDPVRLKALTIQAFTQQQQQQISTRFARREHLSPSSVDRPNPAPIPPDASAGLMSSMASAHAPHGAEVLLFGRGSTHP